MSAQTSGAEVGVREWLDCCAPDHVRDAVAELAAAVAAVYGDPCIDDNAADDPCSPGCMSCRIFAALATFNEAAQGDGGGEVVAEISIGAESIDLHRIDRRESPLGDDAPLRALLGDGLHKLYATAQLATPAGGGEQAPDPFPWLRELAAKWEHEGSILPSAEFAHELQARLDAITGDDIRGMVYARQQENIRLASASPVAAAGGGLPELPDGVEEVFASDMQGEGYDWLTAGKCYYTPDQMRAYGQQCRLASAPAGVGDEAYLRGRLKEIMPLFQEARDALTAISITSARLHGVRLDLADRMDAAGTRKRSDFAAAPTQELS